MFSRSSFRVVIVRTFKRHLNDFATKGRSVDPAAGLWWSPHPTKRIKPMDYAFLIFPVATFGLGCWQVKRHYWKQDLIERMKTKMSGPAIPVPTATKDLSQWEYTRVKATGHFRHEQEMYITPRSPVPPPGSPDGPGRGTGGFITVGSDPEKIGGAYVVTPFEMTNGKTILVNRGWVSRSKIPPFRRKEGQIEGEIEIEGILRLPEKRPAYLPETKDGDIRFLYRHVPRMAEMTGALPVYIDAVVESTVPGGPVGGQTRVNLFNNHVNYFLTW
ncbi:unnamed protein product [Cyprideis torosa]|uniref:SURF1-like protein n=1 Tax=Cyprideis torosa TaxID=163714 RepID=A0A7R8ZM67_9CRUS|nr:unnamed protein product [Cyprideis torosa]CAG0883643.1 unnamed protein product [Cyprideis torosa]